MGLGVEIPLLSFHSVTLGTLFKNLGHLHQEHGGDCASSD